MKRNVSLFGILPVVRLFENESGLIPRRLVRESKRENRMIPESVQKKRVTSVLFRSSPAARSESRIEKVRGWRAGSFDLERRSRAGLFGFHRTGLQRFANGLKSVASHKLFFARVN